MKFLPYLPEPLVQSIMQIIYPILLRLPLKPQFRKYLLRKARKLINFTPTFQFEEYCLHRISITQHDSIENMLMNSYSPIKVQRGPAEVITSLKTHTEKCTRPFQNQKMINSQHYEPKRKCLAMMKKLKKYHRNAGNLSFSCIKNQSKALLRV